MQLPEQIEARWADDRRKDGVASGVKTVAHVRRPTDLNRRFLEAPPGADVFTNDTAHEGIRIT